MSDDFVVLRVWGIAESRSSRAHEGRATVCVVGGTVLARTRQHQPGLDNTKRTIGPIFINTTDRRVRSLELVLLPRSNSGVPGES